MQPVRVDDGCYAKLSEKDRHKQSLMPRSFEASRPTKTLYQASMQPRDARIDDGFDTDLKKALEMSLEEAKAISGYVPQSLLPSAKPDPPKASRTKDDDEDPELKAAIAASLKDMEEQKKQHAATFKQEQPKMNGKVASPSRNDYELSPVEAENINLFATLVERLQHQPPGTILREPQIQELYESIGALRPKLARTYGETMSKHDTLLDLHSKLSTVVRYYDRMLEERLSSTYNQHSYGFAPSQRPNSMYPNMQSPAPNNIESYYTGAASGPSDPYTRPQSMYASPPAQQAYAQRQPYRQASVSSPDRPTPSRTSSLQYQQHNQAQTPQYASKPSAPPTYYPEAQQYPTLQSQPPQQPSQQPQQQLPPQQYHQPPQAQYAQPQVYAPPQAPVQQQPQQQQYAAQQYPPSFPQAPTHQPVQAPRVEESLIEL